MACLYSSPGGFVCTELIMLVMEAELGRIPEKDDMENDGECGAD